MRNTYNVELWVAHRTIPVEEVTQQVRATDRYEAVALARRVVEEQHPQINLATLDTWFVASRLD